MKSIPIYKFYREKYHKELLMDVVDIAFIRPWLIKTPVYRDNFYRIIFITDGEGEIAINEHKMHVEQGNMICSIPGEVWHWQQGRETLNGYVLLFEEEFLSSFFNDALFLERLSYLRLERTSPFLKPDTILYEQIRNLFILTKEEISKHENIDPHFLRAMLYAILILTNRIENVANSDRQMKDISISRYIDKFIRLVNENFAAEHNAEFYADKLCVTPNYLNKMVKSTLGTTTKLYIQDRIIKEAKKLLTYTTLSIAEISGVLHFSTPAYFNRFFTNHAGIIPSQFRKDISPEK